MIRTNCVVFLLLVLFLSYPNRRRVPMAVLVTKPAPDFVAPAVMADGSIKENFSLSSLRGKYLVLFFWPLDFTFVCPTKIIAHNNRAVMFRDRGVELVGVSNDTQNTQATKRNTPVNKGGIGPVGFPIVADVK